ncbi:immunoglobulin-like domain-containing protein [Maribacter sp. 4G9]|uniref:immunoglobulin-like domain-containing protein n=1 Tax=Maribacter sp. 4G9 TaxID=1889777 RepID=UPI000C161261|nr:immunoglobulin-like domain-containing protein [Maribacter sp. 4G9]PIB38347.1 hypothetical protein BFP75_17355 [Maribacter sp. 4G9]
MPSDQRIVYAGDASKSQIYHRTNSTTPGVMMPPLAKGQVDEEGVALMEEWINQLSVPPTVTDNSPDADVNLALLPSSTVSGSVSGGRGTPDAILYDPVSGDYYAPSRFNEYGVAYNTNLGRPNVDNGFSWQVAWPTPKNINYVTFGGTYPNQPQTSSMWRISYLRNGTWTVLEQGQGGWIDSGIYEWGGTTQSPIEAEVLRVQVYSDGLNDLVSIHLRGRGGTSTRVDDSATSPKAALIQYVPVSGNVDMESPVITLNGGSSIDIQLGDTYTEFGATALDNVDGDISGDIVVDASGVDTNTPGAYAVTYNVSDSAGNAAVEVVRTVNVGDATSYSLTVDNGSGDGFYVAGQVVNIVADAAPSGQRFEAWTGDISFVGSVNSTPTTVTMPSSDVKVMATYGPVPSGGSIWFEDFEDLPDGTTVDNGATAWGSSRNGGTFEVLGGRFWTNGSAPMGTWTSEVIPIGGTVSVSLDVDDSDQKKEASDYLRAFYILDGGTPVEFASVSGDIDPQTFMVGDLVGSSIQIVVESEVSGAPENYYIDNVAVYPTSDLIAAKTSVKSDSDMSVYPNPAKIETSISFDNPISIGTIQIYDVTGKLVRVIEGGEIDNTGRPINVQELPAGVYYVKAIDENTGEDYSSKILIER